MSARAEALRLPGRGSGSGSSSQWQVFLALVVGVAVAVTLFVLSSGRTSTTTDRVPPAQSNPVSHAVAPPTDVLQVGGTSVYRFHPLPGVNTVFELTRPASAGAGEQGQGHRGGTGAGKAETPRVGGAGSLRFHPLP